MTPAISKLAISLKKISTVADGLGTWSNASPRLIPSERVALQDTYSRIAARAHAMTGILAQPATLGVIGPPRAGKTHMIASLLARGSSPLLVRFDGIGHKINFLRQIVPVGARHTMATVVRFSSKLKPMHRGFPLSLRLLSLTEVAQVLGTAYLSTAPAHASVTVTAADVRRLHLDVERELQPTPVAGFTEHDALALKDYFCTRFPLHPLVQSLTASGYWDTLAELAPDSDTGARAELLQLLWGRKRSLSTVFARLAAALDQLGHSRDVATTLDALVEPDPQTGQLARRAQSILSAQTPAGLLAPTNGDDIVVFTPFGQWYSVERAALAALVAEVKFQIEGAAGSLPDQADILEFPGISVIDSRSAAGQFDDADAFAALFARAKQTLLLTRAIASSEVTSLLACIDVTAGSAGDLEPIIAEWVHKALGPNAESREAADSGLFLALTKLDRLLVEPGARARAPEWSAMIASLFDGLSRTSNWPGSWTPSRPFDAMTLCIAPAYKTVGLFDQSGTGKATSIKTALRPVAKRAREAFISAGPVKLHCAAPAAMWDEALTSGDGGIIRLGKMIGDVCHSRTKQRQLLAEAQSLRETVRDSLMRYAPAEGHAFDRRYTAALQVTRRLRHAAQEQRFNRLFAALCIADADIVEVLHDLDSRLGRSGQPVARLYARAAIDAWQTRIREITRGAGAAGLEQVPTHILRHLVEELVVGANRVKLEDRIIKGIETAAPADTPHAQRIEIAAVTASATMNSYLFTLGYDNFLANDHPRRRDQSDAPIFTSSRSFDDAPENWAHGDEGANPELEQHSDWAQAYMVFVEENMRSLNETTLAADETETLTGCLAAIEQSL